MGCTQGQPAIGVAKLKATCTSHVLLPEQLGLPVVSRPGQTIENWIDLWVDKENKVWQQAGQSNHKLGLEGAKNPVDWKLRHHDAGTLLIPKGVSATPSIAIKYEFGLMDTRTKVFDASADVAFNLKSGEINAKALASLSTLLRKGSGKCHWRMTLQLLQMKVANAVPDQEVDWIGEVVLGAQVVGSIEVELDDDYEEKVHGDVQASLKSDDVTASAGLRYSKIEPGQIMNGHMEQLGGATIQPTKFAQSPLLDVLKHVDQVWAPLTKLNPSLWQVIRVGVNPKLTEEEKVRRKSENLKKSEDHAHLVVCGCTGAGKSTFLNAVVGFPKGALRQDIFHAAASPISVTEEITSKKVQYDRFGGSTFYQLTDVPGFNDPRRDDRQTCSQLLQTLSKPELNAVHALVLVANLSEHRLKDSLLEPLRMMERKFGEKMWDNLILVLTHIHGNIKCEQYGPAREWITTTLPGMKREWVSSLSSEFEAARLRWVDRKNMVFTIDSEVLRGDGSEHVELVPISDFVHERKVSKGLHRKFPDQVFHKDNVRQCPTDMDLQWKDSALSALREHSMQEMEDLRELVAMNAKEEYYVAVTGGLQTDDVHIGTEFKQLHSAGSTTSMDWKEPVKPQLHSAGSIISHWEEPVKQQFHSAASPTPTQWEDPVKEHTGFPTSRVPPQVYAQPEIRTPLSSNTHQPNAKQVEASAGMDFLDFGSVLRNMTSCSSGHCVQKDQEVARHDHRNSACA